MIFFDAHTHINEESFSAEERKELIRALEENTEIAGVADIGYDMPSSCLAAETAKAHDFCVAAVGVHPHDTEKMTEDDLSQLRHLAEGTGVHAIGEIGLDYHYMHSSKEAQRLWFRRQIRLANELSLPIVIHSREAGRETMEILIEEGAFARERKAKFSPRPVQAEHVIGQKLGGVLPDGQVEIPDARVYIHCFSGSAEMAREYVTLGATIGICGPVTYKNNRKTVRTVEKIPLEYLLLETDAPFLSPEPMRGKPNRPWYIRYTAERVAEILHLPLEEVAAVTTENARRFYGIR